MIKKEEILNNKELNRCHNSEMILSEKLEILAGILEMIFQKYPFVEKFVLATYLKYK